MLLISLTWLVIVILIWSVVYYMSIEKTIDYFNKGLENMIVLILNENYSQAQIDTNDMLARWNNTEKLWVYFVHQADVDDIGASLLKIDAYIKTQNTSMILSEIEQLKKYMKMVKGNESLTLENIF